MKPELLAARSSSWIGRTSMDPRVRRRDLRSEPDHLIEIVRFDDNKAPEMLFRRGEWAVRNEHIA